MIVSMRKNAASQEIEDVVQKAKSLGFRVQLNEGTDKTVIAILGGNTGQTPTDTFGVLPGVESVTRIMKPYKLASREFKPKDTIFNVGKVEIGGNRVVVMSGPCAVESRKQLEEATKAVMASGATILRGGAFKPRTSPFSFQGLEKEGLELLGQVKKEYDITIITEVVDPHEVAMVAKYADILQAPG